MRGTERSAESSTGLTICHKGIGKEQASLSGKAIRNLTSFTYKAILHLHRVVDRTSVANNRILTNHTCTYEYRGIHRTHHRTLRKTSCATNLTIALDNGIRDVLGIYDFHIITNITTIRARYAKLILNHLLEGMS